MKKRIEMAIVEICLMILLVILVCGVKTSAEPDMEGLAFDSETGDLAYYKNGKVDTSYNGFAVLTEESGDKWFFVEKGKVSFKKDDIVQGTIDGESGWYLIRESTFTRLTIVANNRYGWWYVKDGKVDFDYNGFGSNEYGWWYLEKGKVNFDKKDIILGVANTEAESEGEESWWYVKDSKVTNIETVAQNRYGWWYVKDGKVDFSHNGVEQNEYGWWYIHDGKVDFRYNGFEKNKYGWWYLEDGQVSFAVNGIINGNAHTDPDASGEKAWWYVKDSKVVNTKTVAQNSYGWWYVKDGKVDFSHNGVEQNEYGWWRIEDGKVNFNFHGVAENSNGWWYLKDGKVDFNYNGLAKKDDQYWYMKEGKADFTYTGPGIFGEQGFHLINGKTDWNYNDTYVGETTYSVKNGVIQTGWVQFMNEKYYFAGSGKMATETVLVDSKPEVFHMDGRWIDTSSMDAKAAYYNSATDYLILVDTSKKVTKIYKRISESWTPFQNYLCTVGDTGKGWDTIKGSFAVGYSSWGNPYTRGYYFNDSENHTLYYWTRFCDDFLFHSMLYDHGTHDLSKEGNGLGVEASHGCVRLRINNAKWIYDNIPDSTRVIVY